MRIYLLTQEDPFHIPLILDRLFSARRDIVGVGIVPGELRLSHVRKYFRMMGLRDFLLESLNLLAHRSLDAIANVVPLGHSHSVSASARRAKVPCQVVPRVNDDRFVDSLRRLEVDLIVSIACPQVFGPALLGLPARGCINLHGSLLPRYQGVLPSFWVLAKGERETGATVHYMDEAIDHGDIILQQPVPIRDDDTVFSLVRRSKVDVGRHLLVQAIRQIERGEATRTPMDMARASYVSYPDDAAVAEFRRRGRRFI